MGGRGEEGDKSEYFLYVDAADLPGSIVTLPFAVNLCRGSELFVSAWVKGAGAADAITQLSRMRPCFLPSTASMRTGTRLRCTSSPRANQDYDVYDDGKFYRIYEE